MSVDNNLNQGESCLESIFTANLNLWRSWLATYGSLIKNPFPQTEKEYFSLYRGSTCPVSIKAVQLISASALDWKAHNTFLTAVEDMVSNQYIDDLVRSSITFLCPLSLNCEHPQLELFRQHFNGLNRKIPFDKEYDNFKKELAEVHIKTKSTIAKAEIMKILSSKAVRAIVATNIHLSWSRLMWKTIHSKNPSLLRSTHLENISNEKLNDPNLNPDLLSLESYLFANLIAHRQLSPEKHTALLARLNNDSKSRHLEILFQATFQSVAPENDTEDFGNTSLYEKHFNAVGILDTFLIYKETYLTWYEKLKTNEDFVT